MPLETAGARFASCSTSGYLAVMPPSTGIVTPVT